MLSTDPARAWLAEQIRSRVIGDQADAKTEAIMAAPGPRWFAPDSPVRLVHADASMFVGGLRALLLQSLHPLAMAGVAQHSDFRHDPWGRLQRTAEFVAATSFGPIPVAEQAVAVVHRVHERVVGTASDGRPYAANDPHLLRWVHIAEIDSFLLAHRLYGAKPLDQSGRDAYVSDTARVASALGVVDPPQTEAELRERIEAFRPELRSTEAARDAARFLLITPPLPLLARGPYGVIAATSVSMLPSWARLPLRLPYFPPVEATAIRAAGRVLVGGIRWAMSAHPPPEPAAG